MNLVTLPEPITLRDLVEANEQSRNRTPGLHLTDIVRTILVKIDPKRYSKDYGPSSENWQEAGFVWEDILSRVFALRASTTRSAATRWRPGELLKDGILLSPDGLCIEPELTFTRKDGTVAQYTDALIVEEYKATWKSARGFDLYDKRFLWWLLQLQGYCYAAGTTLARLFVLHINGQYESYIPQTTSFILEFPQMELDDQWASFLNTARNEGWLS
jgi:hypothetical protein